MRHVGVKNAGGLRCSHHFASFRMMNKFLSLCLWVYRCFYSFMHGIAPLFHTGRGARLCARGLPAPVRIRRAHFARQLAHFLRQLCPSHYRPFTSPPNFSLLERSLMDEWDIYAIEQMHCNEGFEKGKGPGREEGALQMLIHLVACAQRGDFFT